MEQPIITPLFSKICGGRGLASRSQSQVATVSPVHQESGALHPPGKAKWSIRWGWGTHMWLGGSQLLVLPEPPAPASHLCLSPLGQGEKGSPHQPQTCTQG